MQGCSNVIISTADLMESAKNHLLARGWTQHRYARRDTGEICVMKALYLASRELTWPRQPVYHGVAECVSALRPLVGEQPLSVWNDCGERTPEDVLALLDAGIALVTGPSESVSRTSTNFQI
jgi:hypothetical protein